MPARRRARSLNLVSLTREDVSSKRHPALFFSSMILSENRYPLFRIMLDAERAAQTSRHPKIALAGYELLARGLLSFD
jgi:hypothetical protein